MSNGSVAAATALDNVNVPLKEVMRTVGDQAFERHAGAPAQGIERRDGALACLEDDALRLVCAGEELAEGQTERRGHVMELTTEGITLSFSIFDSRLSEHPARIATSLRRSPAFIRACRMRTPMRVSVAGV